MNADQAAPKIELDNKAKYSIVSLALVMVLFFAVLLIIYSNQLMIAPEVALDLEAAKLIVLGKIPYGDFFSLSSPVALYSAQVPALVSKVTYFPASLVSNQIAFVFSLFSVLGSAAILLPRRHHREWHYFPLLVVALALANVLMLFQLGQKEHLAMIAAIPYFLIRWLRWNGRKITRVEAVATGVFAGFASCLWYPFLLMGISLEFYWLLSLRRLRPLLGLEVRVAICTAAMCLLSLLLLPEVARDNYFSLVCPLLSLGYQCHDWSVYGSGSVPERRDIFYVAIAAILFVLPFRNRTTLAGPVVVLFLVGFALYLWQLKGLSQSTIPMIFATSILLAIDLGIAISLAHKLTGKASQLKIFGARAGTSLSTSRLRIWKHSILGTASLSVFVLIVLGFSGIFLTAQVGKICRSVPEAQYWAGGLAAPVAKVNTGETDKLSSCAAWLNEFSHKGDEVLFLTDGLLPGYPLMLQMNRRPSGYLLQSDCLIELEACERESLQPKKFEEYAEKLYSHLNQDIASKRAKIIFVQNFTVGDLLKKHKVDETLHKYYELKGHTQIKTANEEPVERTGFNYKIGVFVPRSQPL
ncbi:hypothetical protein BH11CYA1_BH11CYA1_20100 [soil metagenome]